MDFNELVELGLNGKGPIKLIMKGSIEGVEPSEKVGVVSVVYVSQDLEKTKEKLQSLRKKDIESYYMVYSCKLDVDLDKLEHYPSIAITADDFN